MKILHVSDFYESRSGHLVSNISERLKEKGHDVKVYASSLFAYSKKYSDAYSTIEIKRFAGFKIAGKVIYPGVIPKLLFQKNPDVVHSHVVGFFSTFVTGYLKKIKKYPLVILADFDVKEPYPAFFKKIYTLIYRAIPARLADVVITFTEKEKEEFSRRFNIDREKIEVLPIGIDYEKFSSSPKKDLRRELDLEDKFIILNISYVIPKKRLEVIIRALKAIDNDRVIFLHVGNVADYDYKVSLDSLIEDLELKDRAIFLENVPYQEIYSYYKIADIFIQTGYRESFAIPVIEAMASGVPVIATDAGISKEVIVNGKTGFIADAEEEIAKKIKLLITDRNLKRDMGENCKKVAKEFDWEPVINRLEDIYKMAIVRSKGEVP